MIESVAERPPTPIAMSTPTWSTLGHLPPSALHPARLNLHYAAQLLAAAAYATLPTAPDHSHSNFLWSVERDGLVGRPLSSGDRVFLDPVRLRCGLLNAGGAERGGLDLEGMTLTAAFDALAEALRRAGAQLPEVGLELPAYDLPAADLAQAGTFGRDGDALAELSHWFHDAQLALAGVAEARLAGAEVRGWPHHFDLAALRTLDPDADPEAARSVGAGFSPGDGSYAEPYFYVSPWPAPAPARLPDLGSGAHWHTAGFTSAVLPASAIVAHTDGAAQARVVQAFLDEAVGASLGLLEG